MPTSTTGTPDETTLEDLAAGLDRLAEGVAPSKSRDVRTAAIAEYADRSELFRKAASAIRHHATCRKMGHRLKIVGASAAALFALATALVGQSADWANHNLDLAYGLLIGGSAVAVIAGGLASYLGATDPTKVT